MVQQAALELCVEARLHAVFEDKDANPVEVFVVEVKAPGRNKNSNDFIKLGFTLKLMLDALVKRDMNSPHVVGLLVDGYDCYLYMMMINHEAIYELVELEVFALPKSANELPLLKDLFEAIFRVKAFVSKVFEEFESLDDSESGLVPLCHFTAK
ncbi:hypothetical protein EDC96DRAFT_519442 [Choanephora cucurbitarum]|nr:hypothetical protein EDC96DRAFT_519442 [Choanephora cucurbitarum]